VLSSAASVSRIVARPTFGSGKGRGRGVRLNVHPKFWPFNVETADHLTVAIVESGANPDQFLRKAFPGVWADERNLADEERLIERRQLHLPVALRPGRLEKAQVVEALQEAAFFVMDGPASTPERRALD
jgi:hypothetical protein